jgi:hypothetical protein
VRIVAAVCDMGVVIRSCSDNNLGRLRVQPSAGEESSLCGRGGAKGVQWVAVAKGVELRIATTHSERGVRSGSNKSSGIRSSNNVGGLRVHAGVYERHLL